MEIQLLFSYNQTSQVGFLYPKKVTMLSRRADYAVRAMIDIARQSPSERNIVAEIAKRQDIPASFLGKIVSRLARAGLVHTSLGAAGGIALASPADEISLLQIIQAIDQSFALTPCSLNPSDCPRHTTCSASSVWCTAQAQVNQTLAQTRLSDLITSVRQPVPSKLNNLHTLRTR